MSGWRLAGLVGLALGLVVTAAQAEPIEQRGGETSWSTETDITINRGPAFLVFTGHGPREIARLNLETGAWEIGPGASLDDVSREVWRLLAHFAGLDWAACREPQASAPR